MKKKKFVIPLILIMAIVCSFIFSGCQQSDRNDTNDTVSLEEVAEDLEIYCFSAGKADAFLLSTSNSAVLIDAGEKGFGKEILNYLEEKNISKLDMMIITHFDKDHVGGAAKILNTIQVDTVLQSNSPKESSEYTKYITALTNASIEPITVRDTYNFTLDNVRYSVDPPKSNSYKEDSSNNSSLIISVYNGLNSFLFMGDAQTERIEEFISDHHGTYDLLKVPHHGKAEPLFSDLLNSTSPFYAIITSSDEQLEDSSIIELLKAKNVQTFLTRIGEILIESNGIEDFDISYVEG